MSDPCVLVVRRGSAEHELLERIHFGARYTIAGEEDGPLWFLLLLSAARAESYRYILEDLGGLVVFREVLVDPRSSEHSRGQGYHSFAIRLTNIGRATLAELAKETDG